MKKSFNAICRLSQDTTNELWSFTLRRAYKTPAEKKRAIERVIRGAIEQALGATDSVSGWNKDTIDEFVPLFGRGEPRMAKENPYS